MARKARLRAAKVWRPIADTPPADLSPEARLLVYCPTYGFQPVRPTSVQMLPTVLDATHWTLYVSPYPAAPRGDV